MMLMLAADSLLPSAQQMGIIAVLLAAVVASFYFSRRRRPTDGTPKQYRRELDSAAAQGRAVQRDMEQLLTELEQLAGRLTEQFDSRRQDLQQLLAEADKRITAMRILLDEARRRLERAEPPADVPADTPALSDSAPAPVSTAALGPPACATAPPPSVAASQPVEPPTSESAWREVVQPAGLIASPPPLAAHATSPAPAPSPAAPSDARPAPDRRRRIYQLADEGLSPMQIALQLGQPVGEVELILNLRTTAGYSEAKPLS